MKTHTGHRDFECDFCHSKFTNRTNLNNHKRIHNNEKPYRCGICSKHFREYSTVFKHMKSHGPVIDKSAIIRIQSDAVSNVDVNPSTDDPDDPDDIDDLNLIEYDEW